MSPLLEPVILEGRGYTLRHVGPQIDVWPSPPVAMASFVLLNQPAMVARELPMTNNPNSPDMVSGTWSGRIGDAGDFALIFPNKEASDGRPWRNRFDPFGKNQWIEIRNDGYLECCGCIEKVDRKRDQIVVSGHDGWFQLKNAYERDWTVVKAPRDVIERGTAVWSPIVSDDFTIDTMSFQPWWQTSLITGGTAVIGPSGGAILKCTTTSGSQATLSSITDVPPPTNSGARQAGAGATNGTAPNGGVAWINTGNITLEDGLSASAPSIGSGFTSQSLVSSNHGFAIPTTATVAGILVEIKRCALSSNTVIDDPVTGVRVWKAGVQGATERGSAAVWPTLGALAWVSYGGPADLWGTTWTPSDINNAGFGASIRAKQTGGAGSETPQVDVIRITVYYTYDNFQTWRGTTNITNLVTSATVINAGFGFSVQESSGHSYGVNVWGTQAQFSAAGSVYPAVNLPTAVAYSLMIESDGEWVWGYVNGTLIGPVVRRADSSTNSIKANFVVGSGTTGVATSVTILDVLLEAQLPFLMVGTDKGDYVLPGDATTYPVGGLHGRYSNNSDLGSDANRLIKIHSPTRTQAFAGSGTNEYSNRQDARVVGGLEAPLPGVASNAGVAQYWSVVWFGAIYLKLSAGDYAMNIQTGGPGLSVRCWVGKTNFGDQLVDQWILNTTGTHNYNFTISQATLAGSLPYGAGTVARDGWYPIKIEYAVDSTFASACTLQILNSPTGYTDPGGTVIAAGAQTTTVPATSLSPLGMADQRYQGISHFDLVQQTLNAFGYEASVEPKSLESGQFPGVLAPRIREGQDFDAVLEPDDNQRTEGLVGYSNTLDATDSIGSLTGNGSGFQSGVVGQLQALVYDHETLGNSLFDIQGWQDFSDASFGSLLQALLNGQLGLRLQPWQVVSGDPVGRPRLANAWPLPSALAQMRWRPGDGIRIYARDISLQDLTPRQLLLVTRQIHPNGATGTQVGFAARPRTDAHILKQTMFQANRWQRNYQRQLVTLNGNFVIGTVGAGADGAISGVIPLNTDTIVRARLRVSANTTPVSFNVKVNGVDQTTALIGPWTSVPLNIDLTSVAVMDVFGQLYATLHNNSGGSSSQLNYQFFVDVLR